MELNFTDSLIIAAILQGLWLSFFILISKKFKTRAAKYLGLLILVVTLTQLQYFLEDSGAITWQAFNITYFPFEYLEIPFLYLFVSYYLNPYKSLKTIEKLLFLPFAFYLIITLLYKGISLSTNKDWSELRFLENLASLNDYYGDFLNIITLAIIIPVLLLKLSNFKKAEKTSKNSIVLIEIVWLKILLVIILCVLVPWSYFAVCYYMDKGTSYLPVEIIVSVIIYLLGYIGIHKINIQTERKKIRSHSSHSIQKFNPTVTSKKVSVLKIEKMIKEERRFQDPSLSAEVVAASLGISTSHLSRILKNEMNTSFSEYVNSSRVEEAKLYLKNPEFKDYTLVAIGLEAGFNSKTTFNTTFKKMTGKTPSQFKKLYFHTLSK